MSSPRASVLQKLLGTSDRAVVRPAAMVLIPAGLVVAAAVVAAQVAPGPSLKRLFDNVHWTVSYGAAAVLAWIGVRTATPGEAAAKKWFAWALTFYVFGQVLWDVQVATGWNPFPGPSDVCYVLLGPLTALGLASLMRHGASPAERRTAALDVAGLSAAVLALTLALYLPKRGDQALLPMVFLVAYPVVLSWAACLGLIAILALRLVPRRGAILFLVALLLNGALWLQWNSLTLDNALQDGTWYNATFSLAALMQGVGALLFRVEVSQSRAWERSCEGFLRLLPLITVVVSAVAAVFAYTLPGVPPSVQWSALIGGLVVVLLASVRQSVLLGEHERLIRAERELRTTETKYRATLDLMPIPVCITTHPEGKLVDLNRAFTQMIGVDAAQATGKRPSDLGVWANTQDRDRFVQTLLADGQVQGFETEWKARDGTMRPSMLNAAVTELEGRQHCVLAVIDIDERKRAEAAIKRSEEKYRLLVEQAADGIFIADADGRYEDVNPRGADMLGMSREEIIGLSFFDVVPSEEQSRLAGELSQLRAGRTVKGEWRMKRKGGGVFWAEIIGKQLPDGRLQGLVRDVSDRKQAELAKQQADEARKALELQLRQSQKMEAVGSLAAGIAHDFNNILSAIRGNADLAALDIDPSHPAAESLAEIQKAGRRAAHLVQQIVAFSRPHKPSSDIIGLTPVIEEVVRFLRSTLPAAVEISTSFDDDAPAIRADPTQIHQVVLNLCTNACQAIEGAPGRIDIRVERRTLPGAIALDLPAGEYACIVVRDTGKGMSAETRERIFEPFFTTKDVGQGTGLGLSVVHNIVKSHRGAIHVESAPGSGSTFSVYLPSATAPEKQAKAPRVNAPAAGTSSIRVVYVDDDEALTYLMTRQLKRRGHDVRAFSSPLEALKYMQAEPSSFDVVVTDFNMPRMSGIKLMHEVLKVRRDAPFILTSGSISDVMRAQAERAGVRHLIQKPDSDDELGDAINSIARERAS